MPRNVKPLAWGWLEIYSKYLTSATRFKESSYFQYFKVDWLVGLAAAAGNHSDMFKHKNSVFLRIIWKCFENVWSKQPYDGKLSDGPVPGILQTADI